MLTGILIAFFLPATSYAARTSKRSTAFLSAGVQKQRIELDNTEMTMLAKQLESDIDKVQKVLLVALEEFNHLVPKQSTTMTNSTVDSKQKPAPKQEARPSKEQAAAKVKANATNSTKASSNATISSKRKSTETVHASSTNSSKVPSAKDANTTAGQAGKPVMAKSSNPVAATSINKKAHVKKIAQAQQTILQNLFKHLKANIVNLNKEENKGKQEAQTEVQQLQARLKRDKEQLNKTGLSKFDRERLVNRTRMDTFELQYWTRDRSLEHSMFHTNLKMQHALMSRVKTVISACKEAAAKGRVTPMMMRKLRSQAMPNAFMQMRWGLKHKAEQYHAHVLTGRWMLAKDETE